MSMALVALAIDLMLPGFDGMRADLGLAADSTAVAGAVTAYFLGMAGGTLLYGPLADHLGRRPALYLGYGVYAVGALASALAPSLGWLLASRVVWGLGGAGPRVITLAVIRDTYDEERMSRAMSLVLAVFILVPVIAPTLGAGIIAVGSWRWTFGACVVAVAGMAVWARRLPETLHEQHRLDLRFARIATAARSVVANRRTAGYTLAMTVLFGSFMSYIASAEIIFSEVFGQQDTFPLIFGCMAAVMGVAMLTNARIVERVGTRRLAYAVLRAYVVAAVGLLALALATGGRPPLALFLVALAAMLASHALLIPNLNTLAMDPMSEIAGTASSVIGAVQIAGGALLGAVIDQAFQGTIIPLAVGFLAYGVVGLALMRWAERGAQTGHERRQRPSAA